MSEEAKWDEEGIEDFVASVLVYARLPVGLRKNLQKEVENLPDMIWGDYVEEARKVISLLREETE